MVGIKHHYMTTFNGATYDIGQPRNVGELKSALQEILEDLPEDESLAIDEVVLEVDVIANRYTISYTLTDPLVV